VRKTINGATEKCLSNDPKDQEHKEIEDPDEELPCTRAAPYQASSPRRLGRCRRHLAFGPPFGCRVVVLFSATRESGRVNVAFRARAAVSTLFSAHVSNAAIRVNPTIASVLHIGRLLAAKRGL
jgi:hypothetical protein